MIKTKYTDMKRMATEDFFKLSSLINETWESVLDRLEESREDKYENKAQN
ncbi:MAG: hypothetical protein ACTSU7_11235 [Candidatus Heimdallarchaeaceae archaeon]